MGVHSPWTALHAQIHQTLRQRRLLTPNSRILMAISGGQDSLCLAQLLLDLQPKWGWHLAIAHCDHRWPHDSPIVIEQIANLAQQWHLPFFLATATDLSTDEASARQWRYAALTDLALENCYTTIVTGHTASDRAETLLYNLLRGSGADGLQALTWQRPLTPTLQLVRPLLDVKRSQTGVFCQSHNLPVWTDLTNCDRHYARNRLRQDLIPYLEQHFNPQVQAALAQTAELLRADVDYLQEQAQNFCKTIQAPPPQAGFNRALLQSCHLALQRRVARQLLRQYLPSQPQFDHIEKLLALLNAPNRSQTDPFPGGTIAYVEDPWIRFKMP